MQLWFKRNISSDQPCGCFEPGTLSKKLMSEAWMSPGITWRHSLSRFMYVREVSFPWWIVPLPEHRKRIQMAWTGCAPFLLCLFNMVELTPMFAPSGFRLLGWRWVSNGSGWVSRGTNLIALEGASASSLRNRRRERPFLQSPTRRRGPEKLIEARVEVFPLWDVCSQKSVRPTEFQGYHPPSEPDQSRRGNYQTQELPLVELTTTAITATTTCWRELEEIHGILTLRASFPGFPKHWWDMKAQDFGTMGCSIGQALLNLWLKANWVRFVCSFSSPMTVPYLGNQGQEMNGTYLGISRKPEQSREATY